MAAPTKDKRTRDPRSHQERLLDESLEETFPASDPISMEQVLIVGRAPRSSAGGISSRAEEDA
jgi:hypothetical protein